MLSFCALLGAGFAAAGGASLVTHTHDAAKCKKGYKRVHGKCVKIKKKKKPTTTTVRTTTTPTTTAPPPKGGFPTGVYFIAPSASDPDAGTIRLLGGSIPSVQVTGHSFDVGKVLVWVNENEIHVVQPGGAARTLYVNGLFHLSHPSLAPDGTKVVVQATQNDDPDPTFVTPYVIDLADGSWRFLAPTGASPYDGNDFPAWSPTGDTIAYESTESAPPSVRSAREGL